MAASSSEKPTFLYLGSLNRLGAVGELDDIEVYR